MLAILQFATHVRNHVANIAAGELFIFTTWIFANNGFKERIVSQQLSIVAIRIASLFVVVAPPVGDGKQVQPRRILLVEDNEIDRRVALGLLHACGHQVVVAENGLVAVNLLSEYEFHVILMDMQMPVMDGYEATTTIRNREHKSGGHTPMIAMTVEALKRDRERCLEVGMDDYCKTLIFPSMALLNSTSCRTQPECLVIGRSRATWRSTFRVNGNLHSVSLDLNLYFARPEMRPANGAA